MSLDESELPAAYDLIGTVLPQSLARELCLTGRSMAVEEARACGFVSKVVAPDQLSFSDGEWVSRCNCY